MNYFTKLMKDIGSEFLEALIACIDCHKVSETWVTKITSNTPPKFMCYLIYSHDIM